MNDLKTVKGNQIQPNKVIGAAVLVYLKIRENDKAAFWFKIISYNTTVSSEEGASHTLNGYDDERLNISIDVDDIEFITIK